MLLALCPDGVCIIFQKLEFYARLLALYPMRYPNVMFLYCSLLRYIIS
jgi:hypothetical protein